MVNMVYNAIREMAESLATQISFHAFTFLINLYVIRNASIKDFGVGAVSLELLHSLILFLPVEGFRRAALRRVDDKDKSIIETPITDETKLKCTNEKSKDIGCCDDVNISPPKSSSDQPSFVDAKPLHSETRKSDKQDNITSDMELQSGFNVAWLGIAYASIASVILIAIWIIWVPVDLIEGILEDRSNILRNYYFSVVIVGIGSLAETLAEPFIVCCYSYGRVSSRARADGISCLAQSLIKAAVFITTGNAIKSYAVGLFTHCVVWLIVLWYECSKLFPEIQKVGILKRLGFAWFIVFPRKLEICRNSNDNVKIDENISDESQQISFISPLHRSFLANYLTLSVEKGFLAEGEKLLLMFLFKTDDWGAYGLVSALGSIVCRIIFLPVEETTKALFSRHNAISVTDNESEFDNSDNLKIPHKKPRSEVVSDLSEHCKPLQIFLSFQGLIGLLGAAFGQFSAFSVIYVLYGKQWALTDAPLLLQRYCYLLFLMSTNGILEAYMYSQASPKWLKHCQTWNIYIWVSFATSVILLQKMFLNGASSVIYSSCIAVFMRMSLCIAFLHRQVSHTLNNVDEGFEDSHQKCKPIRLMTLFRLLVSPVIWRAGIIILFGSFACYITGGVVAHITDIINPKYGTGQFAVFADLCIVGVIFCVTIKVALCKDVRNFFSDLQSLSTKKHD